jgi:hypothetical protein
MVSSSPLFFSFSLILSPPPFLASSEAQPVSFETLSASLEVLSSPNSCNVSSSSATPPFIAICSRFKLTSLSNRFLAIFAALCHRRSIHLPFTRRRVFNTCLRVDLTRGCVSFTRRLGKPPSRRSTAIHLLRSWFSGSYAGLWSCTTTLMTLALVFGLFYLLFSFLCNSVYVSLWLNYLPSMVPDWFSAVLPLRQPLHSVCWFTGKGLLTELLCYLHRLARPWNRPGLPLILLEFLVNTIACCLVLLNQIQFMFLTLHCWLSFRICCWDVIPFCVYFGFIVGEPTPLLFLGSPIFSSFWIRSGNDPPL